MCWTISSATYMDAAIVTLKESLKDKFWTFPNSSRTPMMATYVPELDDSPELDAHNITFYQELIGILRWETELGRVDILHEVSILSQYQASPRRGHLEQLLKIFAFLDKHPKFTIYMDSELPKIDYSTFKAKAEDFHEMYRDAEE